MRCAAALAALLAIAAGAMACGSAARGGGAGGPDFQVTVEPPRIDHVARDQGVWIDAVLEVRFGPPLGIADELILGQSGEAFDLSQASATLLGPGHFRLALPVRTTLPPGISTGAITLQVCPDLACLEPHSLSTSSVPYTVTVP